MDSLLLEINEQANNALIEKEIISNNVELVAEYLSMSTEQLNEAISSWLAKVRASTAAGRLDPAKKDSVSKILGALSAITNTLYQNNFS